jgi:hypothetical protein
MRTPMTAGVARFTAAALLAAALLAACGGGSSKPSAASTSGALNGLFKLTPGACTAAGVTGSFFQMITPGGTIAHGKFFENPDSTCPNKSYTPVTPGTSGGFVTGTYQPNPSPAFDRTGDALAASIIAPQNFTAIKFALSTNRTDPQSGKAVPAPVIKDANGVLSGQLEAWSAAWNNQYFNQGSPKPGGAMPGLTSPVTGTYNPSTGAFVLTWASEVVGGPFNGFSGYWHLTGTFVPEA